MQDRKYSVVLEQNADAFTVVDAADGLEFERSGNASGVIRKFSTYLTHLSENVADLQNLELWAAAQVLGVEPEVVRGGGIGSRVTQDRRDNRRGRVGLEHRDRQGAAQRVEPVQPPGREHDPARRDRRPRRHHRFDHHAAGRPSHRQARPPARHVRLTVPTNPTRLTTPSTER